MVYGQEITEHGCLNLNANHAFTVEIILTTDKFNLNFKAVSEMLSTYRQPNVI